MSVQTALPPTVETTGTPTAAPRTSSSRLVALVSLLAIVVGAFSVLGGLGGVTYTYRSAAVENITTPGDAAIAEAPVRGPLTMWAQSDIITQHQLNRTEGLRYAEMPREIPMVDEAGEPVIGEDGEPVMGPNTARLSWIDATALTTVLGVGILAYAFSAFAIAVGAVLIGLGLVVRRLGKAVPGLA
jgi:hypothetical protein